MDEKLVAKVEEVMKDESFVQQLAATEEPEEAQKLFASRGIDFTLEEVKAIAAGVQSENGELGEDDLEAVSGGSVLATIGAVVGIVGGVVSIIDKVRKWKW